MKKVREAKKTKVLVYLFLSTLFLILILIFPIVSAIVINEILPNAAIEYEGEWFEFYGNNAITMNLTGWKITDGEANFTINETNITLSTNEFILFVYNLTHFNSTYNLSNLSNTTKIIEYGSISPNLKLANSVDNLELYNSFNELVDEYIWIIDPGENVSFARCPDGSTNWTKTSLTPGTQNNCTQQQLQQPSIELIYPQEVECNENFSITINAFNFEDGVYDVKIDILSEEDETRVGKVWNGTKWLSTNSYVNSVLNIVNGNGTATLTYQVKDFEGEAILRPRIRETGSSDYEQFDDQYITVQCEPVQEESSIKITDAPDEAKFGDEIEIELEVYKGDTTKYAVYVYVQDENEEKVSNKVSLHFYEKFTHYSEQVELELKCKNEEGTYEIVAEGLDTKDTKKIELTECNESIEENASESITIGDFTYIINVPNTIYINKEFFVEIKIISKSSQEQEFLVWSYVYRGSVCHSCSDAITRESNAKVIVVQPNSFTEVKLQNIVKEAELGDYKIKIKIQQQGLKTPKEFSYDMILDSSEELSEETKENVQTNLPHQFSYQRYSEYSYSQPIKTESFSLLETLPYILVSTALILAIYLIIEKI